LDMVGDVCSALFPGLAAVVAHKSAASGPQGWKSVCSRNLTCIRDRAKPGTRSEAVLDLSGLKASYSMTQLPRTAI
jgi:hypothetical protein